MLPGPPKRTMACVTGDLVFTRTHGVRQRKSKNESLRCPLPFGVLTSSLPWPDSRSSREHPETRSLKRRDLETKTWTLHPYFRGNLQNPPNTLSVLRPIVSSLPSSKLRSVRTINLLCKTERLGVQRIDFIFLPVELAECLQDTPNLVRT